MPPNCSRCVRWRICNWRGKNCCFWHRLRPGALVADHGRAAEAGRKTRKNRIRMLARDWLNTYYLEDTGLFRVSLGSSLYGRSQISLWYESAGADAIPEERRGIYSSWSSATALLNFLYASYSLTGTSRSFTMKTRCVVSTPSLTA